MNILLGHSSEHHLHRRPDLSRGGRLEVARSSGRIHVLVASDGAPRIVSGIQAVSNSDARLESFGILGHCHVIVRYNHAPSITGQFCVRLSRNISPWSCIMYYIM